MVTSDGTAASPDAQDAAAQGWTPVSSEPRSAGACTARDVVTGLPNHAVVVDRIGQALAQDRRSGGCTAVVSIHLDRFESVSEAHGQAASDLLLRRVASQLVGALRMIDTVVRVAGAEFVVLAPGMESPIHAADMSARLVTELARRPRGADGEGVAASIGLAVSVAGRGTGEVLLQEAGVAMQRARALGGARAEAFDNALWLEVEQRWVVRQVLQAALDDRRVVVHYQPVVDVASGAISGYETLTRIADTDGTILPAARLLSSDEDSEVVVALARQALGQACDDARAWQPDGATQSGPSVAIDLTARQFRAGDLVAVVRDTLRRTGLDPSRLHLELNEAIVADAPPQIVEQLHHLRVLGVQIGLDAFGTGYVSLVRLRRLPLTYVKVDRRLVRGAGSDPGTDQVLAAVIGLIADLGLRSIAEGVETPAQLDRLRVLRCDEAQGDLLALPMPVAALPSAADVKLRSLIKRIS